MIEKKFKFHTNCIDAVGEDIQEMTQHTKNTRINYNTMRKHCVDLSNIAKQLGYDRDLPIQKDWHVGYYKSFYKGKACYFFQWSRIEYIFLST